MPEAVTKLGEPILCNVIPGGPEREHLERERGGKTLEDGYLQERVTELKILIRNWVKAVVELFHELGKPPKCGRVKPLLAMPLIGTGGGGGAMLTGLIANMIVELIPKLCEEFAVDILLCVSKESEYKLVQERRQKKEGAWGRLTASNKKCAEKLAGYAKRKHLCFFLGAGVSAPAGLPSWNGLLEKVNADVGSPLGKGSDEMWTSLNDRREEYIEKGDLKKIKVADGKEEYIWDTPEWKGKKWDDFPQLAEEIQNGDRRSNDEKVKEQFKSVIAKYTDSTKHAIGHALLACMPVRAAITQNYDTLFEKASHGVNAFEGRPYAADKMAILPYAPKQEASRWLLKMHGCVSRPDSIVLTSEDYIKYETSSAKALGGLVQSELMISHMMFVGFSMTDPNFERLIQSVKEAYGDDGIRKGAGTIINLTAAPAWMKEKYAEYGIATESIAADIEWCGYNEEIRDNTNPSREIEIWYDYMAMRATDTIYPIFDKKFETALSPEDKVLRDHLRKMLSQTPQEAMSAHAWENVVTLCKELGIDEDKKSKSSMSEVTGLPPRGHMFATMCLVNDVAVDYWLLPCREIHERSVGLEKEHLKRNWLKKWIASGALDMPEQTLGKHSIIPLCEDSNDGTLPQPLGVGPWSGPTVGRLKDLPDVVLEKGEPILCNIIPGSEERGKIECERKEDLEGRVAELEHLVKNWVDTVVTEIFLRDGKPPKCGRVKPLLALPLIGTGASGGVLLTGMITEMLVDLLPRLADVHAVDILLCIANQNDFMLVQERRKQKKITWSQLTESNKKCAREIAEKAKKKQLVCFFLDF